MGRNNLEDRLIRFTITVLALTEEFPNTKMALELKGQLVRSAPSFSLNYAEAQGAESRRDFIHKLKIVLKELRETNANLKIVFGVNITKTPESHKIYMLKEADELISIIVTSIRTATYNDEIASKKKSK